MRREDPKEPVSRAARRPSRPLLLGLAAAGVVLVLVGLMAAMTGLPRLLYSAITGQPLRRTVYIPKGPAMYIGAATCRECHAEQHQAWTGSHHDLAMQPATPSTVLGNFNNAVFDHFGTRTEFFKRDGKFMVRTDGPDGAPTEYTVEYTFGVFPLQQYLIAFPGGRYQALSIAWDSRPRSEDGGQRWFHLYPDEKVDHTDQLHWTARYQNWNMMCAECHSTNLRKGYDAATDTYRTTYNEINVACESCHGPGSRHADWARNVRPPYEQGVDNGLTVALQSDWFSAWRFETPDARFPVRDTPPSAAVQNVCAACHARRSTLAEGVLPGAPLEDSHRLSLPLDPLYFHDGQQRDEVYVWGSFLQSRMHMRGVTCMDCHDAHSLKIRSPGNDVCARCHTPATFDSPSHHFHKAGSTGASCVACHMPTRKYMVVHDRLDHSIRVPRPDLAETTGAPDACTMCHTDRTPQWAAEAMDGWYSPAWRARTQWGATLAAGATQGAKAIPSLLALAQDATAPAIIRASAGTLAGPNTRTDFAAVARTMLADADPTVRIAGLQMLQAHAPAARAAATGKLLSDPVRGVRIEAANLLADIPPGDLPQSQGAALELALKEYEESLRLNADWPAENLNAGNLALRRGRVEQAITAFRRALELDPRFAAAYVNLSDVYRQLGDDPRGEGELRRGLTLLPRSAELHHALGLLLVRRGDRTQALAELEAAATLEPENARYAYVYAVGLHSAGRADEAIDALRQADARNPFNPEILSGVIAMLRERGRPDDRIEALAFARRLAEAYPDDAGVRQLLKELSGPR